MDDPGCLIAVTGQADHFLISLDQLQRNKNSRKSSQFLFESKNICF